MTTGDPNHRGLPNWPRYRSDLILSLVPDAVTPTSGFAADHRCSFWQLAAGTPA